MRITVVGFCLGVISLVQFSFIPPVIVTLCLAASFLLIAIKWPYWLLLVGACLGLSWAGWDASRAVADRLDPALEGEKLAVIVKIVDLPQREKQHEKNQQLQFNANIVCGQLWLKDELNNIDSIIENRSSSGFTGVNCPWQTQLSLPSKVKLTWYGNTPLSLQADQIWYLVVKLKQPHGFANPGGFDYEKWLFQKRIGATGSVVGSAAEENVGFSSGDSMADGHLNRKLGQSQFSIDRFRQDLSQEIRTRFNQYATANLLPALVVGDRSAVSKQQWEVFRTTGTSHLFAISGLHIGLVAGLFYCLAYWLSRHILVVSSLFSAQKVALLISLIAALAYSALAGFAIPTLRSLLMLFVIVLFRLFSKQNSLSDGLLWAAAAVLLLFPRSPLDAGFWLSFVAVSIIFWVSSGRIGEHLGFVSVLWRKAVYIQWGIFVCMAPLLIFLFDEVSVISPAVNIIAVPFVSILLVPAALIGSFTLVVWPTAGQWLLSQTLFVFDWVWASLELVSQFSGGTYPLVNNGVYWAFVMSFAAVIVMAPRALPMKWIALVTMLPLLRPIPDSIGDGGLKLAVLDVGHGLSVLVRTNNHTLLFDAGNRYSPTRDAGQDIIIPYLREKRVEHIDKLILSHGDIDHIGGAQSLLDANLVKEINGYTVSATDTSLNLRGVGIAKGCHQGDSWEWDGIHFTFIFPEAVAESLFQSKNNLSCVLKVVGRDFSILIPADIEREAEEYLLKHRYQDLNADILIAPHHGSRTSSSTGFINAVSPRYVVFTAGYQDRFGHPVEEVVDRYTVRKVKVLNTSLTGTVEYDFIAGSEFPAAQLYRQQHSAYWRSGDS